MEHISESIAKIISKWPPKQIERFKEEMQKMEDHKNQLKSDKAKNKLGMKSSKV